MKNELAEHKKERNVSFRKEDKIGRNTGENRYEEIQQGNKLLT